MSSNFGKTLGIFLTIMERADIPDDNHDDHDNDHNQWYPTIVLVLVLVLVLVGCSNDVDVKLNKDLPPLVLEVMSAP